MLKFYIIVNILVISYLSQVQNSILVNKLKGITNSADKRSSKDSLQAETKITRKLSSVNRPLVRLANGPQNFNNDGSKAGGTLIVEGLNSLIYIPRTNAGNSESFNHHITLTTRRPRLSTTRRPSKETFRPTNRKPTPSRSSHRPRPTTPFGKPYSPTSSKCDASNFLAFLGIIPMDCTQSGKLSYKLDNSSQSRGSPGSSGLRKIKESSELTESIEIKEY